MSHWFIDSFSYRHSLLCRCIRRWASSCVLCRNFISIYRINKTLHGRLGIQILSSRAESISHSFASLTRERYFQHSKIKFISPRGHVISSISWYLQSQVVWVEVWDVFLNVGELMVITSDSGSGALSVPSLDFVWQETIFYFAQPPALHTHRSLNVNILVGNAVMD